MLTYHLGLCTVNLEFLYLFAGIGRSGLSFLTLGSQQQISPPMVRVSSSTSYLSTPFWAWLKFFRHHDMVTMKSNSPC